MGELRRPEQNPFSPGLPAAAGGTPFVVGSESMAQVWRQLCKVAPLDTTVLLLGESGTGKELAASILHEHHPSRRHGRQVHVHCGAIPESLLESELFGHVRGAFTGADHDRAGVFEQAHGGTLFLDEVSTMTPQAQVRLLRVLQDRRVTRLGSSEPRSVDVRVVAASNDNLRERVDHGTFRLDLFYRLSAFPIVLPPLRERPADIPPLAERFCARMADKLGLPRPKTLTADARSALLTYTWPGNVRELDNAIEYACIVADARERLERQDLPREIADLPPSAAGASSVFLTEDGVSLRAAVTHLERELILQSLRLAGGNKARAAGLLRLKRTTFLEKLRRLEQEGLLAPPSAEALEDGGWQ
jgi:DNA-binding NtrC family response regulator